MMYDENLKKISFDILFKLTLYLYNLWQNYPDLYIE